MGIGPSDFFLCLLLSFLCFFFPFRLARPGWNGMIVPIKKPPYRNLSVRSLSGVFSLLSRLQSTLFSTSLCFTLPPLRLLSGVSGELSSIWGTKLEKTSFKSTFISQLFRNGSYLAASCLAAAWNKLAGVIHSFPCSVV